MQRPSLPNTTRRPSLRLLPVPGIFVQAHGSYGGYFWGASWATLLSSNTFDTWPASKSRGKHTPSWGSKPTGSPEWQGLAQGSLEILSHPVLQGARTQPSDPRSKVFKVNMESL